MASGQGDERSRSAIPLPDDVVVLMSGDQWSGAFQAGALAGLEELNIEADCVIGSGFGAINAVIVAGSAPPDRQANLTAFWTVSRGTGSAPGGPGGRELRDFLDGLVDWKRVNGGSLRCCLVTPGMGGGLSVVDNAIRPLGTHDVIASVGLLVRDAEPRGPNSDRPEEVALGYATDALDGRVLVLDVELPPAAPSPPTDASRERRRDWLEQSDRRASGTGRPEAATVQVLRIPGAPSRRRPSERAFRPGWLLGRGRDAVRETVGSPSLIASNILNGRTAAFDLIMSVGDPISDPVPIGMRRQDRTVGFLYKTVRRPVSASKPLDYTGERDGPHYGAVEVRVPEVRAIGSVSRPFRLSVLGIEIGPQEDPTKHFTLKSIEEMDHAKWCNTIRGAASADALVFVHGFNVSFMDGVYRFAQIVWDLKFAGLPVLFSWASRGGIANYGYDRNSALIARQPFVHLLTELAAGGVRRVHVLAHSMGNFLMLEALGNLDPEGAVSLAEVIMAAPDVDADQYRLIAPKARRIAEGMTLYASSVDRALMASKRIAGKVPRAGDVVAGKPALVERIDAIDATAIGVEMFGLNHGNFASDRTILDDVKRLIHDGTRPPSRRGVGLDAMPDDVSPAWWRFAV